MSRGKQPRLCAKDLKLFIMVKECVCVVEKVDLESARLCATIVFFSGVVFLEIVTDHYLKSILNPKMK